MPKKQAYFSSSRFWFVFVEGLVGIVEACCVEELFIDIETAVAAQRFSLTQSTVRLTS